jgi:esterase/lipase superfamily enzyme
LTALLRRLDAPGTDAEPIAEEILECLSSRPGAQERLVRALAVELPAEQLKGDGAAEAALPGRYAIVPVYYATNRAQSAMAAAPPFYGTERGELGFGFAQVSIPDDHRMGELEAPRWWKLQFREDPEEHVVLLSVDPVERPEFVRRIAADLHTAEAADVLLFIHGYNVSFEDAARRTAQVAYDLNFGGVPLLFSWPSHASLGGYVKDANNARWSATHLAEIVQLVLAEVGAEAVHVIAHSMGNIVLTDFLRTFAPTHGEGGARLRQVVFAAPDVDAATFKDLVKTFRGRAERFTMYASSEDVALKAAKKVQGYSRAGESGRELVVVPGLDTIDATRISTGFLGHSYVGDNDSILADIYHLLSDGRPPPRFRLRPSEVPAGRYWIFQA